MHALTLCVAVAPLAGGALYICWRKYGSDAFCRGMPREVDAGLGRTPPTAPAAVGAGRRDPVADVAGRDMPRLLKLGMERPMRSVIQVIASVPGDI